MKRFPSYHYSRKHVSLEGMYPEKGVVSGGTEVFITVTHSPFLVESERAAIFCKFSSSVVTDGSTSAQFSEAYLVDDKTVGCISPDFSSQFVRA